MPASTRGSLKKRGEIWHARVKYKGKEYPKSLETTSKTVARERLAKYVEELIASNWGEKPRRTFDETMQEFIKEHFPNVKHSSATRYATSLDQLLPHFSGLHLDEISSKQMFAFESFRKKQGRSPSTIRRDFNCLSVMYSCAEEWEWYDKNPVKPYLRGRKKKGLKEAQPRTVYLSLDQEIKVLENATEKMAPLIAFAIDTGLRREEQFSLTWSQVDLKAREIHIGAKVTKSSKQRFVPITDRAQSILEAIPRNLKSPYVFLNGSGHRYAKSSNYIWGRLQKAAAKSGIEDIQWHDLRRTCGCRLLQERGFSMEEVRDWLGHSSVKVTEKIYAFLKKDQLQKRLRKYEATILDFPG